MSFRFPSLKVLGGLLVAIARLSAADIDRPKPATTGTNAFRSLAVADRVATPLLAPASREAEARLKQFKLTPGLKVDLWAAEPMLANPVAFCVDELGRIYTSETYRYRTSVLDIRHYMFMLEDDLASQQTEQRLAGIRKWFGPDGEKQLSLETEVIRQLVDTDRDGKADQSSVFADGFNSPLSGIASGVLARHGEVWVTEIPSLWRFTPDAAQTPLAPPSDPSLASRPRVHDDNYHAQELLRGWGVRFSFTGHDLHGLKFGPDGRLYFSVGDRGTHVVTREGRTIDLPDEGAVFRCEPDGTNLEVVARGLRNPQELAFNEYGELFSGDNDSDQGDRERWVHVVDGMDAGWRVGHQHAPLGNAGMWNLERLWVPHFPGQAAYILPPIANIGDGPSGLVYDYGTSFPARLKARFLLAYFKGTSSRSGIYSVGLQSAGAGYELTAHDEFVWNSLVPDVDLGPDGSIYFADWHEGWPKSNKGRIYRAWFPEVMADPAVKETQMLLAEGMAKRGEEELTALLAHRDMRVRQEAQFELAGRGEKSIIGLARVAAASKNQLARLHALWGLGQLARQLPATAAIAELEALIPLTLDPDAEVRGHVARLLGEARIIRAQRDLIALTTDAAPRVVAQALAGLRYYWQGSSEALREGKSTLFVRGAAATMGRAPVANELSLPGDFKAGTPVAPFFYVAGVLDRWGSRDLVVRHQAVQLLVAAARRLPPSALVGSREFAPPGAAGSGSRRLGLLLALRTLPVRYPAEEATLTGFLFDSDPLLVLESARAIHDVPITNALPALAALAESAKLATLLKQFAALKSEAAVPRPGMADISIPDVRPDQPLPWTNAPVDHLTPMLLRIVNANFRVGDEPSSLRLAALATNTALPEQVRIESLQALSRWENPPPRDRITGLYRPLAHRPVEPAYRALRLILPALLDRVRSPEAELVAVCQTLLALPVGEAAPLLESLLRTTDAPDRARAAALRPWIRLQELSAAISSQPSATETSRRKIAEMLTFGVGSPGEALRLEASKVNAELNPNDAVGQLARRIDSGSQTEQQSAYSSLGGLKSDAADAILADSLDRLMRREIAPEVTLELVEAAEKRTANAVKTRLAAYQDWKLPKDHLTPFREALVGGDAARGRKIFYENAAVACTRCHQIGGDSGGNAGPKLDGLATSAVREHLLESVVFPNQQVTPGFEAALITRRNGEVVAGTVRSETALEVIIINPEDSSDVRIPKSDIVAREKGVSGMPEGFGSILTRQELRDIIEFLGTLK